MSRKVRINIWLSLVTCVFTVIMFMCLTEIKTHCSYEQNVSYYTGNDDYVDDYSCFLFLIESSGYVINPANEFIEQKEETNDYFNIIRISGYEAELIDGEFVPTIKLLLLSNDEATYKIKIYKEKRTDLCVFDGKSELKYGFFCYVPEKCINEGEYKVGMLVVGNGKKKVLWTENVIKIK